MNNYIKGAASLLTILWSQKLEIDLHRFELDDYQALKSDWERIGKDLEVSLRNQIAHMDTDSRNKLAIAMIEQLKKMNNLTKELHENLEQMKRILDEPTSKKLIELN